MIGDVPGLPHLDGVTHRFVDLAAVDGPLRVHVAEAGDGPPVLLLHGWPQHWWCWRRVVPLLAPRRRLVMPDLRGFGWSGTPGRGQDPDTFAADAVALLDALGLERVTLAGHDWGGFTALLAGISHPERFDRIVAVNTPLPWVRVTPRLAAELWRSWYTWAIAAPGLGRWLLSRPGFVERSLRADLVHRDAITRDEARVYGDVLRAPARIRASQLLYRSYQRALADVLRRRPRGRLAVPTHLLFGIRDRYVSRELIRGGERHADALVIEEVADSGHFLPEERPDLVAARLAA